MKPQVNIPDKISMTLESINISESYLRFDYTVNNYSPHPVYLFSNLACSSRSEEESSDPNLVYAWLENRTTLSLAKQLLIAPEEIAPDERSIPFVSTLESHWTMTETLRLPLPIELFHPYYPRQQAVKMASVTQFSFTLGYLLIDRPIQTEEVLLRDGTHLSRPSYQDAVDRQRLKQSRPVRTSLAIDTLKRH